MIKLIASDMDGTLLDENSNLPNDFFDILKQLDQKNIKFVVASGRPYSTLIKNFAPFSDKLWYISDNGSYTVYGKEKPDISVIPKKDILDIVEACENISNIELVLCGVKNAYSKKCFGDFANEIDKYYIDRCIVDTLSNIDDDIFKVSICDMGKSAENSYKFVQPLFENRLSVVVSAEVWVDFTNIGVNKGEALKKIQQYTNISYSETMAFGDFYNDVELLQNAHYSFVMKNANENMYQYGNFIAKSNRENGVIEAIKSYVI